MPYTQDFSKVPVGRTPGGWVEAQGKYLVKELDGKKVLAKNNTIASLLAAKANTYITLPGTGTGNFTVQADVRGSLKNGQYLPDMGLINCRYTLILSGSGQKGGVGQKLSLQSWDALPRIDQTVPFIWNPGTWYTMKLSVEQSGGKAQLKGKVWERGQPKPGAWTVTFEDPTPNGPGSAGLHGYSTDVNGPQDPGTEIYYDNVKVTPHKKEATGAREKSPKGAAAAGPGEASVSPALMPVVVSETQCAPGFVVRERRLFGRWRR